MTTSGKNLTQKPFETKSRHWNTPVFPARQGTNSQHVDASFSGQPVLLFKAAQTSCWDRTISRDEYGQVQDAVENLGFLNGWVQDFEELAPKELLGFEMDEGGGERTAHDPPRCHQRGYSLGSDGTTGSS